MKSGTVVILRQSEDSEEFVQAIESYGYTALVEPILSIEYLDADFSGLTSATPLIFTSAHGARAFARKEEGRDYPVFTVGRNTAEEARALGITTIESAEGTVEDLAELLSNTTGIGLTTPIYVRAEQVSRDLKGILAQKDLIIHEITGYKAVPAQKLSIELLQALDKREIKAIALFSSRGGSLFAELVEQYGRTVRLKTVMALCISEAVLQSVSVLPFQQTFIAEMPDRYGMMNLLDSISVIKE